MWPGLRDGAAWLADHNLSAPGWAGVAAAFSALSSFLIWRVQRSNLLESVRPELVLLGWYRVAGLHNDSAEQVCFRKIKNVGRGVALHVHLHAYEQAGDLPTALMSNMTIPLVAVSDEMLVECPISVWFKNVPIIGETRALSITVGATCYDSRGDLYQTEHNLIVVEGGGFLTDQIADGVTMSRTVTMTPAWRMRLRAKRLHGISRLRAWRMRLRAKSNRLLLRLHGSSGLRRLLPRKRR
jgi:hypothetical protein